VTVLRYALWGIAMDIGIALFVVWAAGVIS
jgi:hypothetical protein